MDSLSEDKRVEELIKFIEKVKPEVRDIVRSCKNEIEAISIVRIVLRHRYFDVIPHNPDYETNEFNTAKAIVKSLEREETSEMGKIRHSRGLLSLFLALP